MEIYLWNLKWRWFWFLCTFATLSTDLRRFNLPICIQKYRRSSKGVSTRACLSSNLIWLTTNLRTSKVTQESQKHRISFITFTTWKVHWIFILFAASASRGRCKKTTTCWIMWRRSKDLQIVWHIWGIHKRGNIIMTLLNSLQKIQRMRMNLHLQCNTMRIQ